jgi:Ca2+-dependent lipid-binding protein
MMQKFWPMLAIVGEQKAVRIGQPILTRMKPSFLSELTIKRFSFGTIAPRFLGIRMHQTRDEEGVIRCDLEMRYAGDPQIIIQVGPTEVEILNLRISCMLRCEMLEFCPKMTPFKLASATMMKKPFVDFNIKVAGMDIMGTKSMTNLVHSLFHKVLQSVAMYPKKIFVPMGELDDSVDIEKMKALTPVGILYLTLERGVDLIEVSCKTAVCLRLNFFVDRYVDLI